MNGLLEYIVKFKDGVKEGPAAQLYYPATEEGRAKAATFVQQHDEKGFSVYSCIGKLRDTPRKKENVAELDQIVVDLDLRNIAEDRERVLRVLRELPLPPEIRDSGRGIHAVWHLKEPLIDDAGMAQAENVMRRLVSLLAGDPKPTHRAALLRHLGTHNSRDGGWRECCILEHGKPCDISEFGDLFDLYGDVPLLSNKEGAAPLFNGEGKRLPIDLQAMRYQGNPGMHDTFLGYMGSRLSHGDAIADIIEQIVEVAERNCAEDPERPNWRHDLARKATWWLEKHPEWVDTALDAKWATAWTQALEEGRKVSVLWVAGYGIQVRRARGIQETRTQNPHKPSHEIPPEPPKRKSRFKFTPSWELQPGVSEVPYLIDELIPAKGIVLLWGPPKCLKSFFVLGAMWHVANGWEFHDRAVQQGPVIYCAFEGSHGYTKRVPAQRVYHGLGDDDRTPVTVMSGRTDLIRDHGLLVKEIREYLGDVHPVAVVMDTLNKSLVGSESKDLDMAAYIRAAETVRDAFDCVVIVVHHCGWDESRMRGHSSLRGAVDAELAVTREGDIVTVTVEEMRDGPDGVQLFGKSKFIEVGQDAGGRPLGSLVIEPYEPNGNEAPGHAGSRWPKAQKIFHEALTEATIQSGFLHQIPSGPQVQAVAIEHVRTEFFKRHICPDSPTDEQAGNTKRKAFARALERARRDGLIGAYSGGGRQIVWQLSRYA